MEMFKKVMNIITTIVPRTSVRVVRRGGYHVVVERSWLGRTHTVEIAAKEASRTDMSLLDLL